jgi:hypothetical protein
MRQPPALAILTLLVTSLFTPLLYAAPAAAQEAPAASAGFCDLASAINVTSLSYEQATALQGIATQDVATSAEDYRRQLSLEKLGAKPPNDRQQAVDKFNFYFMGPDGPVFYDAALSDLLKPSNGFLLNTVIDGRVEYGGHLRENLALCGKSPANDTTNVCSRSGDVVKAQKYLDQLKTAKTGADIISFVVSLSPTEELTPSDTLGLSQSRVRSVEFTTSMANGGPNSVVFVLPQALVIYTAAMKKLDMLDLALSVASIGSMYKNTQAVAKATGVEKRGIIETIKGLYKGISRTPEISETVDALRFAQRADFAAVEGLAASRALAGAKDAAKLAKEAQLVEEHAGQFESALRVLAKQADEEATGLRALVVRTAQQQARLDELDNLIPKYTDGADAIAQLRKEAQVAVADGKANVAAQAYSKIFQGGDSVSIEKVLGKGQATDINDLLDLQARIKGGHVVTPAEQALINNWNLRYGLGTTDPQAFSRLSLKPGATDAAGLADLIKSSSPTLLKAEEIGAAGRAFQGKVSAYDQVVGQIIGARAAAGQRGIIGNIWSGFTGRLPTSARSAASGGAGAATRLGIGVLNRLAAAMYLGPGTKAVLFARGFHYVNDLFLRKGFFELTGAGMTLRYNKDEIGTTFKDDSVVVLLAQNELVRGLTSAYIGGDLGAQIYSLVGEASPSLEPLVSKANVLGDVLLFGGIMYPPSQGIVEVTAENPKGVTRIEPKDNYYLLHIREWQDHVFTAVEDTRTMQAREKGSESTLTTAMGLWTHKVDLYGHMFSTGEALPGGVFTQFDQFIKQIGNWGVFSNLLIASSSYYMFLSAPGYGVVSRTLAVLRLPLGLYLSTQSATTAGKEFISAKYTSMKDIAACIQTGNTTNPAFSCARQACSQVLERCFRDEGTGTTAYAATTAISYAGLGPWALAGTAAVDVAASIYKMQVREQCLAELSSCQEHTFTVLGAATYRSPELILAEQQSEQLKALPGLEKLPVKDFLDASGLGNITSPVNEFSQQQLNVHTEQTNASGRIALDQVYYTHLKDVSIQWVEGNLPINFCAVDEATGDPIPGQCVDVQGDSLKLGGRTIVTSDLVPFKWMDTELPALVIPNTAIVIDTSKVPGGCALFTTTPDGSRTTFNPSVVSAFEREHFEEVTRLMGTLRDVETDDGAIYPSIDYNGQFRFEFDKTNGNFEYSTKDLSVGADGKVSFENEKPAFRSAIFTGGAIIKRGNLIYFLPKYFKPVMSGRAWLERTRGAPLVSDTGADLEARDAAGNLIGIVGKNTRIPGGEKLGVITQVSAEKDINGDGKITDDEKSGFRFFTEDNKTKFELLINGKKEVYDTDQIEIDEKTGKIKVFEKDQPHTEANLLREIELKVDSLGRTLMTVKDGKGNTLLEEALVTYLKGTGGAIRYDSANNNYIFVNGQPIEVNNDFKNNGFNPITGRPTPPLLQPSAVTGELQPGDGEKPGLPAVPIRPEDWSSLALYAVLLLSGILFIRFGIGKRGIRIFNKRF